VRLQTCINWFPVRTRLISSGIIIIIIILYWFSVTQSQLFFIFFYRREVFRVKYWNMMINRRRRCKWPHYVCGNRTLGPVFVRSEYNIFVFTGRRRTAESCWWRGTRIGWLPLILRNTKFVRWFLSILVALARILFESQEYCAVVRVSPRVHANNNL